MPKEKTSFFAMLRGEEPGPLARFWHDLSGADEGEWGERCLLELLKHHAKNAAIFTNVYVPLGEGTTELDIVLTGSTGLYIFESKAYGGKIYGQPEQLNWTQYLGGKKSSFYNPVRQNENHRRRLAKALQISPADILSFIVFENRADLSNVCPAQSDNFVVCNRSKLLKHLKKLAESRKPVFSPAAMEHICRQLIAWSNANRRTKKQHIKQIEQMQMQNARGRFCPFCGRRLITRQGPYGAFIGCSGYPKCHYTRKI